MQNTYKGKRLIKAILIAAFLIFTIRFLQIPRIIECEILTDKHGKEFMAPAVYKTSNWISDVDFVKVLDYSNFEARVYYVQSNFGAGSVARCVRMRGHKWEIVSDTTVWSGTGGTADGVVMPYWWHNFPY